MGNSTEQILRNYPRSALTHTELSALLGGTDNSQYAKTKRLLAKGVLLPLRRGLYCLNHEMGYPKKPHPYELAQYIYGPSYISLESALSFHHLIPEAVHEITSVSSKRSKTYNTPLGSFTYVKTRPETLYTEVELIQEPGFQFLMAKPWKAICDYLFCYKKEWLTLEPFVESLRVEADHLPPLRDSEKEALNQYYHNKRLSRFLNSL